MKTIISLNLWLFVIYSVCYSLNITVPTILDGVSWIQYEYFEKPRLDAWMRCIEEIDHRHPGLYPVDE